MNLDESQCLLIILDYALDKLTQVVILGERTIED